MEPFKISAKSLGATALEDFCPRCFWLKLHIKTLPWQSFPGIFASIDGYTKKCFHHIIDSKNIPSWMKQACDIIGYENPPHWSKSLYFDAKTGITLSGVPDDIWITREGKKIIPDAKTAMKTKAQDKLFPMYEIQELVYSILIDKTADLWLVYMEPQTGQEHVSNKIIDCGFDMGFSAVMVPVENDKSKVREALNKTRDIYEMKKAPDGVIGCKDCLSLNSIMELL
jgi:hypothetical protein